MQQYERVVEDIMTILTADADPSEEALRDVDTRYADAVNAINERLLECDRLLRDGHRTEAIQKCEAEPSLLDAVSVLDFPEAEQWGEYVKQFGFAQPPMIRSEIAAELNDAYTAEDSLVDLLKQHRLFALGRISLGSRLKVLRQIARRDASNPIWQQDVRSWEQVRHNQLKADIDAAAVRDDTTTLAAIEKEVRAKDWMQPPPKAIVERVIKAHTQVRVKHARAKLETIEKDLTEAYSNFDVHRARSVRQHWNAQAAIGIESDDDPLLELVAPALDWLEEQDRQEAEEKDYEAAIADLEQALDSGAGRDELQRLAHAVIGFERGMPQALDHRLRERFASLDVAARRKMAVILVSIVMFVALAGGIIGWSIFSHNRKQELATHVANLTQLIEERRYPEGTSYLEQVEKSAPHVIEAPEMQKKIKDLESAITADQERRSSFEQALANAQENGKTWDGFGDALDSVAIADGLAISEAERAEAHGVRADLNRIHDQMQQEFIDEFVKDLEDFKTRHAAVDRSDLNGIKKLITEAEVLNKRPYVPSQFRSQVPPLVKDLEGMLAAGMDALDEKDLIARITESAGDRDKYIRALNDYVEAFPTKSRADDLRQVLKDQVGYMEGVEQWNLLVENWSQRNFLNVGAENAPGVMAQAEKVMEQYPGFPATENVNRMLEYLRAVAQRVDEDGQLITSLLTEDLKMPAVVDVDTLWTRERNVRRFYFNERPPQRSLSGQKWSVNYFTDFEFQTTDRTEISSLVIANPTIGENQYDWTSPQRKFSDFALSQLLELTDLNWDPPFYRILVRLHADRDMEPVLKFLLTRRVLTTACEGSLYFGEAFAAHLRLVKNANISESANWVDPNDREGQLARDAAERLLDKLLPPESVVDQLQAGYKAVDSPPMGPQYSLVGWLHRDQQRQWTCSLGPGKSAGSGELVSIRGTSPKPPEFITIGKITDGELQLQLEASGPHLEGQPVYLVIPGN